MRLIGPTVGWSGRLCPGERPAQSSAPRLGGILSPGILTGDRLYCAGAGSRDPKTGQHPEGFEAQVKQSLENLGAVLKSAGLDFPDVVNSNVYLTDIKSFQAMNKVYKTYFPANPPARTTIAVPALPGESHVEITFIASRNKNRKYIFPEGVKPAPTDLYSGGVMVGNLFYLSGQGSRHYSTKQFPQGDFEAHVKQTMDNLGAVLKAAGMDFSNVVKSNVYLTDMNNFQRMNEVYKTYFTSDPPARTTSAWTLCPANRPSRLLSLLRDRRSQVKTSFVQKATRQPGTQPGCSSLGILCFLPERPVSQKVEWKPRLEK